MKKILFILAIRFFVISSYAQVQLYGLTYFTGSAGYGTIFHYTPSTSTQTLDYLMEGGSNGYNPNGSLTLSGRKFYGMTILGGTNSAGVIFEWVPATNIYTKKINFGGNNGAIPFGSLTLSGEKLYGMTYRGGTNDYGVIFEWDPATNIYTKKIDLDYTNGAYPWGSLTLSDGKFYGMTQYGGANNQGVIFEWDPATNIYTKKIDFNGFNGSAPLGSLTLNGGKFYGMTQYGGVNGVGVIFEWNPATNIYTKKIDFNDSNGKWPHGSLTLSGSKFYGMTYGGGLNDVGVIFEWDPLGNIYTHKIDFGRINGYSPNGSLTLSGGKLYGMTGQGGEGGVGVIFQWDPTTNSYAKLIDFNGTTGSGPQGDLVEYNPAPSISITDKSISEGNSGTTKLKFKVTLDTVSASQVTVKYATADSTANAPSDYTSTNGKLKFNPGETSKTITVLVNGDTQIESNEKFKVLLSQPVNATIADSIGVGTIKNDDPSFFATNNISNDSKESATVLVLQVSPNPAKSKINVSGLATGIANYIELRDLSGRSLLKQKVGSSVQTIDLSKYAEGIYVLCYFNGSNWQQIKVVKQ